MPKSLVLFRRNELYIFLARTPSPQFQVEKLREGAPQETSQPGAKLARDNPAGA